ncbi:MAG TPA: RraA family protein [Dehalococcoidia bacterium]|nr:RraA family protein [Dehalococcoidia bacterium]
MDQLVERLLKLDTCAVSDACDRLGLPGAVLGITAMSPPAKIAGRIVTVKLADANGRTSTRHLCTGAIEAANPSDVIVIENPRLDAAGWGGILSAAAKTKGLAGVVCGGAVRDIDESRELDFPVFGRAAIPRTARGRIIEETFNEPISVGDITVSPNDLVLADGSGVVFLAADRAEEVLQSAEMIAAREAKMKEAVMAGDRVSEVMGRDYEQMLKR